MKNWIIIFLTVISSACAQEEQHYVILHKANIIPMSRDTILHDKTITIKNDRILSISAGLNKKYLAKSSLIIDCTGKYIIPGLFDSHFHYGRNKELYGALDSLLLKFGVTNVLAMNGSIELQEYKKTIRLKEEPKPEIETTGRIQNGSTLTKEEAVNIIQEHKRNGYKFVKTYTHLSSDAFFAFNENANKYGIRILGHIPRKIGFFELMKSQQELICHAEEILYNEPVNYLMGLEYMNEPNYKLTDTVASILGKHNKWVSPTLVAFHSILQQSKMKEFEIDGSDLKQKIAKHWNWLPPNNKIPSKFDSNGKRFRLEKGFLFQKRLVKSLKTYKVKMLAGTDAPAYWGLLPGEALHKELALLASCGLTNFEVLETATINAAEFLKIEGDYGTVQISKVANLIILNKNPLDDITNTLTIDKIILKGKILKQW